MYIKLGETHRGVFGTNAFADGSATNADSLPTCVVLDQGTAMGYAPVVANKATGLYEVDLVASGGNGFTVGHEYSLYVVVVLGGKTTRAPVPGISSFFVTARNPDDLAFPATSGRSMATDASGVSDANVVNYHGAAVPAPNVSGVPIVDTKYESGTIQASPTVPGIPKVEEATLESRLTSTRAGYLDNLAAGAVAQAATALSTAQWTNARAAFLDNLSAGAVALQSTLTAVQTAVSAISPSAIATAVLASTLRSGRTFLGHLRRMDSMFFGKMINMNGSHPTGYQPDGVTEEFDFAQDVLGGGRSTANVTGSET